MIFKKDDEQEQKTPAKSAVSLQDMVLAANARRHNEGSPSGFRVFEDEKQAPRLYMQTWAMLHSNPDLAGLYPVAVGDAAIRAFLNK